MLAKAGQFVKSLPGLLKPYAFDLFLLACVVLISVISYNLGRIHTLQNAAIGAGESTLSTGASKAPIAHNSVVKPKVSPTPKVPRDPRVVASKASSSKVYHFTWCSGASRIKESNKLWFAGEAEAQAAGYTLAGNCN
jgi:hypothetical protein